LYKVADQRLSLRASIQVGFEPQGVVFRHDGTSAYVARLAKNDVVRVHLKSGVIDQTIDVGRWPRFVALSPDNRRLAVGTSGDGGISVVDTESGTLKYVESTGINIGHLVASADNNYVYSPWMIYRSNPITPANIRRGWILGSRIARVRLDESARREAITLDPQGEAVADPHGIALTSDEQTMVVSASGTHELLVYHLPEMPFVDFGGPGDHIDRKLLNAPNLFSRITVGGRPMAVRMGRDDKHVFVANYLLNSVQVIDLQSRKLIREIPLGGADTPSLERRGEAIFYDARYSLDQWYSCHSCHYDGGTNSVTMDTLNDETIDSFKTVLPLYNVTQTPPWTWHGWQHDLRAAIHKSINSTMCGTIPTKDETDALIAHLRTLSSPRNAFIQADGSLSDAAQRGQDIFRGDRAQCSSCHSGVHFTDGQIHEVGLGSEDDHFKGFNTPSLLGVGRKVMWLHDGRAKSLRELLTGPHSPANVSGSDNLTEQEMHDLVAYLESL
jgi:DNA-binding beta-propeller fold protein YncE/mono/diheme cytochrome c family protein